MSLGLAKVDAPECPECGCNATREIQPGRRRCEHCGRTFAPPQPAGEVAYRVPFPRLKCPACKGKSITTRSSPAAKPKTGIKDRYHHCNRCGVDFASFETP